VASADLVWIKVPASNALLAGYLAGRARVRRFGYVAGSALAVARGRRLGFPAEAVGLAYDIAGRIAGGRHRIVVGRGIVDGGGIVTSLVEPDEVRDVAAAPWPAIPWRLRLAWAGRLADGKGLEIVLDALSVLATGEEPGHRVELVIIGDGPARAGLEARAGRLGVGDRIHWLGYVADRATYMDALASCDLFVFASPAEGFPKVVLDAMAVGLPVVASASGELASLGRHGLIEPTPLGGADLAAAIKRLTARPARAVDLRNAGTALATAHTCAAEAARLVARWSTDWPSRPRT
jgi:glycosyltransferase involved in cell wall biosynthesis